jgi:NAD(P)-dependent dehydrogenase (short-subunit alcohol dehydrogenase family)
VIISIASINGRQPAEGMSAYCAAKAGLEMLTRCAALELGPQGVRVNAIAPGIIDTPMVSFLTQDPVRLDGYLRNVPLGRVGTTSDVASAAVYLASDEASWVSGETLVVDGAQLTRGYPRAPGDSP